MARPNFKQGKPIAILLITALLIELSTEGETQRPNKPKLSLVNFDQTQGRLIRLKGTIAQFLALILDNAHPSQPWLDRYLPAQAVLAQFYQYPTPAQKQAIKTAFHCLHHCGILSDQRESGCNKEYRHSLLKLAYPITDTSDTLSQNLQWLFQPQGQWDQGKQRITPNPQASNSPAPATRSPLAAPTPPAANLHLIKWAKLLPQDLSHYTPDRLQALGDLIPDLEALITLANDLPPTDQRLILESLIRFYLARREIRKAETYLQQIGQLITGRSPLTDEALASYHHYLGVYHYQQSELVSAQHWFTQAQTRWQQLWQQQRNPNSPRVRAASPQAHRTLQAKLADTCHNLGCAALALGDLATAETAIRQALHHRRQLPGAVPALASSLLILGHIYSEYPHFAVAERIYTETLTQLGPALGLHPLLADLHTSLGHLQAKQGHLTQAQAHYQQAIAQTIQLEGPDSPRLALPQAGLADVTNLTPVYLQPIERGEQRFACILTATN